MYPTASNEHPDFETSSILAFCKQYLREESCYVLQCLTHTNRLPPACFPWRCALPSHFYLQDVSARILGAVISSKKLW